MSTLLPQDDDSNPIPAMRLRAGGAHKIAAGSISARNGAGFAAKTKVVGLYATGPVFVRPGGADVTATENDHYFPGGVYYDIAINGGKAGKSSHSTHLAVLAAGDECVLYISEKE
ncbi:MAG: hypothetical protein WC989_05895 [Micavibrio sp.]